MVNVVGHCRRQADDASLVHFGRQVLSPAKSVTRFFKTGGVVMWYCPRPKLALALISKILVAVGQMFFYHVITRVSHCWVCVVDINSQVCCRTGRSRGRRPQHQTQTILSYVGITLLPVSIPSYIQIIAWTWVQANYTGQVQMIIQSIKLIIPSISKLMGKSSHRETNGWLLTETDATLRFCPTTERCTD